ncbi:MAG: MBL fold metallo-hydrolase [Hyphomonas sp.]|uniref:MBL fold metallo-hydrolase n=1 Tax=Hyphomonas sp. TaxID=87 RepID=UPI00352833DE
MLAGNQSFIFDAGSGGIHKLGRMGFPMGHVQGAFLTHLHSDHIDGLGQLLMMAWIGQNGFRAEPLPVYGPEGTEIVVGGFNAAYSLDRGYRIAHHGPDIAKPEGYGGRAVEILLPDEPSASKIVYDQDGVRITAIRVNHHSVSPAFGYRIDYKDRSISLSGDTIYHPGFATASEGVDVMFHEALNSEMVTRMADTLSGSGRDVTAKLLRDAMEDHSSPEDAARAASEAGATELIYYHIVPPLPAKALSQIWLGDAKSVFSGKVTLGEDGMLISLPAGSTKIIRSRKF